MFLTWFLVFIYVAMVTLNVKSEPLDQKRKVNLRRRKNVTLPPPTQSKNDKFTDV